MSMPELRSDGGNSPQKPAVQPPNIPIISPLLPNPQQRKHWAKQYRTEIAASSSSLLSTFAAVSANSSHGTDREPLLMSNQYPLDSVKTRMQAYVITPSLSCMPHDSDPE